MGVMEIEDIEYFIETAKRYEQSPQQKNLKKLLSVKEKIEIFQGIDSAEIKALVYNVEFRRYQEGSTIYAQGEKANYIYYLLQGEVDGFLDKRYIGTIEAGETFGELAVITQQDRSMAMVAHSKEVLVLRFRIDQDNLEFNARAIAVFYKNLARSFSRKLEGINIAAGRRKRQV